MSKAKNRIAIKTKYIVLSCLVLIVCGAILYFFPTLPETIRPINRDMYGSYDHVFVAKILEHTGSESAKDESRAQYRVRVEKNIMGRIHGTIIVSESRGGVDYRPPVRDIGRSYQFAVKYDAENGWYEGRVLSDQPDDVLCGPGGCRNVGE